MSAECTGWVYRHSPATGAKLLVHLAVADSANDQHGYELWMRQSWLAAKARVNARTAREALAWLCDEGLLVLVESGKAAGKANRYRFLMPNVAPAWVPDGGRATDPGGRATRPTGVGPYALHNPRVNPTPTQQPTTDARPDPLAGFDAFWAVYPRKVAKGAARKAWPAAVKAAGGPEPIIAGAAVYAASPERSPEYTAHPATWLRAERWTDEPAPAPTGRRGVVPPTTNRDTPSRVIDMTIQPQGAQ